MSKTPLPLFALLLVPSGCQQEAVLVCTDDARASILLDVVDDAGVPIESATATYSVDNGETLDCDGIGDGALTCGMELSGTFTLTISAVGYQTETFVQDVAADECHVIGEQIEVTLLPLACTNVIVPSIDVTVTDSQGVDISSADVVWNHADEDDQPEPCQWLGDNMWTCAEEVPGELRVEITNAGPYEDYSAVVTVTSDDCHVLTESLDAVLQYLPD